MLLGPKDISIEKYNRNSHIIKCFSERLELSFVYITRRLKPDFTVVFISLCSPLLHYRIWSLALLLIFWLFHETTKQETSLNSHKWVCLSPSLQFLSFFPHCVFQLVSFGFVQVVMIWQIWWFVKQASSSVVSLTT